MKSDILFLDIKMSDNFNGLDIAKAIRQFDKKVLIIYITTLKHLAKFCFEVNAFRFIEKPFDFSTISSYLSKALLEIENTKKNFVLKSNGKLYKINPNDILYLETYKNKITYYFSNTENIITNEKLYILEKKFKNYNFFRCHRSYLINLNYIKNIDIVNLTVSVNDTKINVSKEKINELKNLFMYFM